MPDETDKDRDVLSLAKLIIFQCSLEFGVAMIELDARSGLPDDSFEVWGSGGVFPNRTYSRQHEAELEVTARSAYYCALMAGLSASVGLALGRHKRMSWPVFLFQWGRARRSRIISRWYGARLPSARIVSERPHR